MLTNNQITKEESDGLFILGHDKTPQVEPELK